MISHSTQAPLQLETERFGEITVRAEDIIRFVKPILGFEHLTQFTLIDHDEDSPFQWLQSLEDASLAFVVTNPTLFNLPYDFTLPEDACTALGLHHAEEASVLTLVTVPDHEPIKMTVNLLGPIVYNTKSREGMQVILDPQQYSTKVRLIPDEHTTHIEA
jgi:flagellar assembly factor FliW